MKSILNFQLEIPKQTICWLENAIVTQTSGTKYLFVQQEETWAQGRGLNQFYNGN